MSFWKRVYDNKKKIFVYGSGSLGIFLIFLTGLSIYGVSIEPSGNITCSHCVSYFNITISNYSLNLGTTFKGVYFDDENKLSNWTLYKADLRYKADNPNRWKPYNFTAGKTFDIGKYEFMVVADKKNPSDTVKWGVGYGINEVDPYWLGEKKETLNPSVIGDFYPSNEIRIESQDYIDNYFNWKFIEINRTHWMAEFSFKQDFLIDVKTAQSYACANTRWTNLKNKYLPNYTIIKICNDIKNLKSD
jgi:hypothetical protein